MEDGDPVKRTYHEQSSIPEEKNWVREIRELRVEYDIEEEDEGIAAMSKDQWKAKVHSKVKSSALTKLNNEKNQPLKSSSYPDAEELKVAGYVTRLTVSNTCLLFRVRSGIVDVKELHRYKILSALQVVLGLK